jgi:dihydrodipicolinate synthase/N-acetylneuraminate lyase
MSDFAIDGIVPIIPTPFLPDGEVDWTAYPALMEFARGAGCCAVCLPAYASEFYKLTPEEHERVISTAVSVSSGRLPVIAQVNTPSLPRAKRLAAVCEGMGAAAVNVAAPRLFGISEDDLFRYFDEILRCISIPLVIQDFNPSGASVSVEFIARLNRAHPRFRYIKLEEPLLGRKVRAIHDATGGKVGVLEGWGGMYLPELVPTGICGVMPGLAVADLLARTWHSMIRGDREGAFEIFSGILPQIVYSLQNMEFYHHAEKRLLAARGVLPGAAVRDATMQLSSDERGHIDFLNGRVLSLLDRLGMPRNPGAAPDSRK